MRLFYWSGGRCRPELLLSADLSVAPLRMSHVLTAGELFDRVDALTPTVAVFDCDGTLWSGDAGSSFMWWTLEQGLVSAQKEAWLRERYDGYLRREVSEAAICGEMVQVYAGLRVETLREAAATFFREHIQANIFPELRDLVARLQRNGTTIWAVSSTNDWVIEEGVRGFGIAPERVLAARVRCDGGIVGEGILDVPTDEGKVLALRRVGVTAPDAVFGNSVHDAAMLAIARGAFPINPSLGLIERSLAEGWAVFQPTAAAATGL